MYYTTSTTTAAPVWASVWACMPEVSTTTAADIKSDHKSRAARLLAALMDYAAGTSNSIKTHAKRTAARIGRAARRFAAAALLLLVRSLFVALAVCSPVVAMFGTALVIPEVTPDGWGACLLLRVPAIFAAAGLCTFVWFWLLDNILPPRLLDYIAHGNRINNK